MTNLALQTAVNQNFNDLYAKRPVWALASNGLSLASAPDPMVALYGPLNPYIPLSVEFAGSAKSKTRSFVDSMVAAAQYFTGYQTQQVAATLFTPTQGSYGITVNSQTGCLNNFEVPDNGNYGFYGSIAANADTLATESGVVVGESNWRQCFDLMLTPSGYIYKETIGGGSQTAVGSNRPFINMNTVTGFVTAGAGNWGYGQIAHNRNTGRLLVVQPNGGVAGTSLTFRLHFIDLQNKIGVATTVAQLSSWITAACGNAARYRYQDVVFSSSACFYTSNTSYDSADTQFVLCNNDEVWAFKSAETNSTGAAYNNALFSVNLSGGTWLTGTYAATARATFATTTTFGRQTAPMYGCRHLNSDDNTVVALFQHSYNYLGGCNLAMVSSASAAASAFNYYLVSTAVGFTIAPTGQANFVLCESSVTNTSTGPVLGFVDNQVLAGTSIPVTFTGNLWPSLFTSVATYANTFGSNMVLKVQPTTEWQ